MSKDSFEMKPTLNNQEIKVQKKLIWSYKPTFTPSDRNSQKVKRKAGDTLFYSALYQDRV